LLLAPFVHFFGYDFVILKMIITLLAVCSFGCIALFFARLKRDDAIPVILLTVFSPLLIQYSHAIMSEIPYLFFSLLALMSAGSYLEKKDWLNSCGFTTVLFLLLAFFTRTIGISLFMAFLAALVFDGKRDALHVKKFLFVCLVFALPVCLWHVFVQSNRADTGASYVQFILSDPYTGRTGGLDLSDLAERLLYNLYAFVFYAFPNILTGTNFSGRSWIGPILALLAFGGFVISIIRKRTMLEWYVACYMIILWVWPWSRNMGTRFVVPLIPFVFYYFLAGVHGVIALTGTTKWKRVVPFILVCLLLVSNTVMSARLVLDENRKNGSGSASGHYLEMAKWIRENTPSDAVFLTLNPAALYMWGHRKSVHLPEIIETRELVEVVDRNPGGYIISHVLVLQSFVDEHPEPFTLVYEGKGLRIYRIDGTVSETGR
jgi:hypothetical protein